MNLVKLEAKVLRDIAIVEIRKNCIDARTEQCRKSLSEQENQKNGFSVALTNLNEHLNLFMRRYDTFRSYFEKEQQSHEDLLATFEDDLQRLKRTKLHPALSQNDMNYLIDCVPQAKLRAWAEECRTNHEQLKSRVLDMNVQQLVLSVDAEKKKIPDISFETMRNSLQQSISLYYEVHKQWKLFSQDHQTVKNQIVSALSIEQLFAQKTNNTEALRRLSQEHDSQLLIAQKNEQISRDILIYFINSKKKMTRWLRERLRSISVLQSKILELTNKLTVFQQALDRQNKSFFQLVMVRCMPDAYNACIKEVSRRKLYGLKMSYLINNFEEILDGFLHDEISKRESFKTKYLRFLPRDFFPGLFEEPYRATITLPPFDLSLPQTTEEAALSSALSSFEQITLHSFSQLVAAFSQKTKTSGLLSPSSSDPSLETPPSPELEELSLPLQSEDIVEIVSPSSLSSINFVESSPPFRNNSALRRETHSVPIPASSTTVPGSESGPRSWSGGSTSLLLEDEVDEARPIKMSSRRSSVGSSLNYDLHREDFLSKEQIIISKLKQKLDVLQKKSIDQETSKKSLDKTIEKLLAENGELKENLASSNRMLKAAQEDHQRMLSKWKDDRSSLESELRVNHTHLANALRQTTTLRQNTTSLFTFFHDHLKELLSSKIAFGNFRHTDAVIFLYRYNGIYEAVNLQTPHYFLSRESLVHFQEESNRKIAILGQIIAIEEHTVKEDEYDLNPGDKYWLVTLSRDVDVGVMSSLIKLIDAYNQLNPPST
eukprot:TRINITY_DN2985_c0_g2_i1.p1 TRINITY_DN2985_c0_g2~~TRINITY_DN2985_c0_g2_i1.p1  ORF type:complete len:892 (-),score=156.66 TRINITY_DN2985_c0_g2_i1:19-2334(-)